MLLLSEQLWTFVSKSSRLMGLGRLGLGLFLLYFSLFFLVLHFLMVVVVVASYPEKKYIFIQASPCHITTKEGFWRKDDVLRL